MHCNFLVKWLKQFTWLLLKIFIKINYKLIFAFGSSLLPDRNIFEFWKYYNEKIKHEL